MALILNIDTATENASVCLSDDNIVLALQQSTEQKNHASFVQVAIKEILLAAGCRMNDIDAVAVTEGPGSYTGLRVGLASAKGLCYALNKPLILINTLEVMAYAAINDLENKGLFEVNDDEKIEEKYLFCPMIDARRMEVFTAIYTKELEIVEAPTAVLLEADPFAEVLKEKVVVFSGSGSKKFQEICLDAHAAFSASMHNAGHLAFLAAKAYKVKKFTDLVYAAPFYLKEFYTPGSK